MKCPRRWGREGRRARGCPVCGTRRARVPKTELAEPTLRAHTTERLAERGARRQTQRPLADSFARSVREGRTGLPHDSLRRCLTAADYLQRRYLAGRWISVNAEKLGHRGLHEARVLAHRLSTVRTRRWLGDCLPWRFRRSPVAMSLHAIRTCDWRK
jgi:hypothetical protein